MPIAYSPYTMSLNAQTTIYQNEVVTKKINVSDLKTGFYFVRLTTNEKQKVYKIFKF